MAFTRVVEVLPPLLRRTNNDIGRVNAELGRFVRDVGRHRRYADVFLVANMKDPALVQLDPVYAADLLKRELGVVASPVIVLRDRNRSQFLTSVFTAFSAGLNSIMVAWGDEPGDGASSLTGGFSTLAGAIREVAAVRRAMGTPTQILAPVNLDQLDDQKGVSRALDRVRAGADMLLAQPPTTDEKATFKRHLALVKGAGLEGKVLLGVFPFKSEADVARYERLFGWTLPRDLRALARRGPAHVLQMEERLVRKMKQEGLPGVYLSTRGELQLSEKLLAWTAVRDKGGTPQNRYIGA